MGETLGMDTFCAKKGSLKSLLKAELEGMKYHGKQYLFQLISYLQYNSYAELKNGHGLGPNRNL